MMKISVRAKFNAGIVFYFVIILLFSGLSVYFINRLSKKTNAILKENHYSVIYAREMTERLTNINLEITRSVLTNKNPESQLIANELVLFDKAFQLEKNNITEPGEDKLVADIETNFKDYHDSLQKFIKLPILFSNALYLQKKVISLNKKLVLLSQMNEKAIEVKTIDAQVSSKKALGQMSFFAMICFLVVLSFTYSFASYFNEKFYQLYNGIKEIASSNYGHRLHFEVKDEFQEISQVFNEMAEKLLDNKEKMKINLHVVPEKESNRDVQELKRILEQIKYIEGKAIEIISKIENKK